MTIDHTATPAICAQCLAKCHELAVAAPGALLKQCVHTGGIVLAVGFVAGGRIICWDIKGPMSQSEAEHLALAYHSAFLPRPDRGAVPLQ